MSFLPDVIDELDFMIFVQLKQRMQQQVFTVTKFPSFFVTLFATMQTFFIFSFSLPRIFSKALASLSSLLNAISKMSSRGLSRYLLSFSSTFWLSGSSTWCMLRSQLFKWFSSFEKSNSIRYNIGFLSNPLHFLD